MAGAGKRIFGSNPVGCVMRSCGSPVLVEQAAEQIASVYLALPAPGNDAQLGGWIRRSRLSARCGRCWL